MKLFELRRYFLIRVGLLQSTNDNQILRTVGPKINALYLGQLLSSIFETIVKRPGTTSTIYLKQHTHTHFILIGYFNFVQLNFGYKTFWSSFELVNTIIPIPNSKLEFYIRSFPSFVLFILFFLIPEEFCIQFQLNPNNNFRKYRSKYPQNVECYSNKLLNYVVKRA